MRRHPEASADPSGDPDPENGDDPAPPARERPAAVAVGPRSPRLPRWAKGVAVAAVVLVAAGALAWRAHHRSSVVAQGLARAEALLRADTAPSSGAGAGRNRRTGRG